MIPILRTRPLLAMILLLSAVSFVIGRQPIGASPPAVRLVIDYADGVEKHFNAIPYRANMNAKDALDAAKALPQPRGLAYESRGSGERALLLSIDGLANEGAGDNARNWLYWINDTPGDRAFAVAPLNPGDTVAWRFARYDAIKPK